MMRGQAERRWMMRTDKLAATWDGFLRMSPGERRVFLQWMRDSHLQRRMAAVYPYRGPKGPSENN